MDRTTISISDELADKLYEMKDRSDTYEDVIWRVLTEAGYVDEDLRDSE